MSENLQYETIKLKIAALQSSILASHPTLPIQLREIWTTLKEDPAIVTLLEPEQVRIIFNGLEKQTGNYVAASMTKSNASKTKALSKVSSSDLGFDD